MGRFVTLLVIVLAVAGVVVWWSDAWRVVLATASPQESRPPTAKDSPKDIGKTLTFTEKTARRITAKPDAQALKSLYDPTRVAGHLTPLKEADIPAQVDGVLDAVAVDFEADVTAGQILARLDARRARLLVEFSRIRTDASGVAIEISDAKHKELAHRARVASQSQTRAGFSEWESASYELQAKGALAEVKKGQFDEKAAGVELEKMQLDLHNHDIKSDVSGKITKVYKRVGESVRPGEAVFRVANLDRLRVEGQAKLQHSRLIHVGMPAIVEPERPASQITERSGHTQPIRSLAVSEDGKWLASASEDRTVRLWSLPTLRPGNVLAHPAEVYAVAFVAVETQQGSTYRLLAGGRDGIARIWKIQADGNVDERYDELAKGHERAIRAVAFSPDGQWCATGGEDNRICVWELNKKEFYQVRGGANRGAAHSGAVTTLHFTAAGHLVSAATDGTVKYWKLGDKGAELVKEHKGRQSNVAHIGINRDGTNFLFDHGNELRILDLAKGDSHGLLRNEFFGRFQGFAVFSPSDQLVLTGAENGRVQLWKVPATEEQARFFREGHGKGFRRNSLLALGAFTNAVGPFGGQVASAVVGGQQSTTSAVPELWDLSSYEIFYLATRETSAATCGVFSPDEAVVFTAGSDGVIRAWEVPAREQWNPPLEARITAVGSQVETGGDVRIRAEFNNPRDRTRRLQPGTRVTLTVFPETARQAEPRP